jgi:anti-sigma B factor antagonist
LAIQRNLVEAVEVTESEIHIIRLKGIFDASTVNEFEKVVSYLLARNFFRMVVDLSQVEFISSAGWGAFTAELRRVRENEGDVKLSGMSSDLFDVFLLLELDHFISAYDTEDEAIMAFLQPPPEPVVESPTEVKLPRFEAAPNKPGDETIATRLPAIYEASSPAMLEQPSEDEMQYQEAYAGENGSFEVENAFARHGENYFDRQENFGANDALAIAANLPARARGAEMYELFLKRGKPALNSSIARRALPPPSVRRAHEDIHDAGASPSTLDRFEQNDFGAGSEFDLYEHDPTFDHSRPAGTHELGDLSFSGHEPIFEDAHDSAEPETGFPGHGPEKFHQNEAEAFSELSLDLESHLQEHERKTETHNAFSSFRNFSSKAKAGFSANPASNETQELSASSFSHKNQFSERISDEDGENFHEEFSETDLNTAPGFSTQKSVFGAKDDNEGFLASRASTNSSGFYQNAHSPSSHKPTHEHDDEFETQDIRDPWILEEIDTLPEEYEMEEGAAVENDQPIAAAEFMMGDFDVDLEPSARDGESGHHGASLKIEEEVAPPIAPAAKPCEAIGADADETIAVSSLAIINQDEFDETPAPMPALEETRQQPINKNNEVEPQAGLSPSSRDNAQAGAASEPETTYADQNVSATASTTKTPKTNGKKKPASKLSDASAQPKIPMSGNIAEMIRGIIMACPDFGPSMICKFLEERVAPPVYLSRSTIYRYLREVNLSTRESRLAYAGQQLEFSDGDATNVAPEA